MQHNTDWHEPLEATMGQQTPTRRRWWLWVILGGLLGGIGLLLSALLWYQYLNTAPANFPVDEAVTIEAGTSVRDIAAQLAAANVVQSESLLYYTLVLFHEPTEIKASTYVFPEPLTMEEVATRLTEGDFDTDLIRVTMVEGERAAAFGRRAEAALPSFSATTFTQLAEPAEGKLFPETYFIPTDFTEEDLLLLMTETFAEQIEPFQAIIDSHSLTLDEILTLASIVEREANSPESMGMVAGIFMNRLEIGMALQADASIEYVIDTPLGELPEGQLAAELRERESPYNTYLNPGLPPTPIGNPGLDAIKAVLEPTDSNYFYYLTGNDGEFYYASTLQEHNLNIAQYLR